MRESTHKDWMIEQFIEIQESERTRISIDLHDSLAQEISMVRMYLKSIKEMEKETESYATAIKEMDELLASANYSIREISHDLSPKFIESNSICDALEILADRFRKSSGVEIEFHCEQPFSLQDKKLEKHVYRTLQEFIQNSLKHSEATVLKLEINKAGSRVEFLISDNGKGFHVKNNYNSIGISNIEMRMKLIGAKYEYFSIPGIGTDLKIRLDEKCD